MAPFQALYGRRCRTPLNWSQPGEREIFGPDLVSKPKEKIKIIRKKLEATQARQKSYHDKRRKLLRFEVGDNVYLKVSPTKGVQRFGIKGKLAPHFIGPYEIIEACGPMAYKLKLPPKMSAIHIVFHVSQLKKCVRSPTEVIIEPDVEIEPDLSTKNTPARFWISRKDPLMQGRSRCIKSNGATIRKKRLRGRLRIFCARTTPDCLPKEVGM
jgi:ribosomal protein L21E